MATKPAFTPSAQIATRSLIVLVLVNIMNFYDRHVGGALAEPLRREFGLTDTQIGWIGTIFTVLYAIIGLPLGRMADRVSRKKLLSAGVTVWGALTAFAAWATSFPMLLVSRLGLAVGEAACAPTATSWIGDLFPPSRRSRPLALFMLGVPVGGALSFFFSGPIAQAFGWRRAMVVAAIPALLLAPVVLMLREPERGAAETHAPMAQGSISQVLRIPTFWWIILSGALVNFNLYAVGTFLPAFMGRIHHLKVGPANIATGVIYAVGGLLGGILGGVWGDRIARRRPDGRMLIAAGAALVAVPLSYFGVQQQLGALLPAIVLLALAYGALNMYYGLVYASMQQFVAPALRGLAMSIYFLIMYLGGASFGPVITGKLSDFMAHRAALVAGSAKVTEAFRAVGLQKAMLVIPVLSLLLALVLWAGSKSMVKDVGQPQGT
ncbi:MAG TPA: MFS transporter [Candidatus Angelobacter sp.]